MPDEVEGRAPAWPSASSTLRATYANALLWSERRASSSAWSTCTIGASFAAYTSGSLITRGSATIVVCGTETASIAAVAVEDVAALGGDGDGADALSEPERREVGAVARLQVEEAHADGAEREDGDEHDPEHTRPDGRERTGRHARRVVRVVRGRAGA